MITENIETKWKNFKKRWFDSTQLKKKSNDGLSGEEPYDDEPHSEEPDEDEDDSSYLNVFF